MHNKTYIIIVTYNGMLWLKKCLDSCTNYPVIVVDNNSKDETVSFIENNYPKVKLFRQSDNLGFGQANNLGISFALSQGANHVFLLNQDAYIIDNCIENLVCYQKCNPEYGILSPIHITASKDKLDKNFAEYMSYKNSANFYSDFVLKKVLQKVYPVPFVNAAAWLISKEVLLTIGGFDPLFFHYGEDNNFCQRVIYHKFKIGVIPIAIIIHDREYRRLTISNTKEEILKNKELNLKIKWANINIKGLDGIVKHKRSLRVIIAKSIFKLSFKKANLYYSEYKLVAEIEPKIINSIATNKKEGSHYLSLN